MKTAVSVPDPVFHEAEKVIQRAVMRAQSGGARNRRRIHGGELLLGPLECRWTTWFTKYGGPTEHKWSNRTQVVQPHASGPSRPTASRHARRRPAMQDDRQGRGIGTAPPPPGTLGSRVLTTRTSRTTPNDHPTDPTAPSILQHARRLEWGIRVDLRLNTSTIPE